MSCSTATRNLLRGVDRKFVSAVWKDFFGRENHMVAALGRSMCLSNGWIGLWNPGLRVRGSLFRTGAAFKLWRGFDRLQFSAENWCPQ